MLGSSVDGGEYDEECDDLNDDIASIEEEADDDSSWNPSDGKETVTIEPIEQSPHLYHGDDLTAPGNNGCAQILMDFDKSNTGAALLTPSVGKRSYYIITKTNVLLEVEVNHRMRMPLEGPVTFLWSTQLSSFPQCCHGCVVVYHDKKVKNK